ncbi:hypothetical protein CY35_15G088600 [Sphagnum magellanicum]|nr:hypothetical protein CY35_15G088600 [Sphagnum magellanicum]
MCMQARRRAGSMRQAGRDGFSSDDDEEDNVQKKRKTKRVTKDRQRKRRHQDSTQGDRQDGELTATVQAAEETSIHESPDYEKVQEKRTETHEAMVDDGGNNDTDIQEVTVESIKETEVPDVLLAEEKSLSPPCSPPWTRSRRVGCLLGQVCCTKGFRNMI